MSVSSIVGLDSFSFDSLWGSSRGPSSRPENPQGSIDLGIYQYSGTFADFSYLEKGVTFFRPYIRGFIVLLLFFFHVRQALSMFGISSGELRSAAKGDSEK